MNRNLFKRHCVSSASMALLALLLSQPIQAQTAPDAGRLLQEQNRQVPQLPKTPDFKIDTPSSQRAAPGGPQVLLSSVQFEGNSAMDADTLQTCLGKDSLGKSYDLAGLQDVAEKISACYRAAGYPFARAYVTAQNMQGGNLRLQIVEGKFGQVRIVGDEKAQTAAFFLAPLKSGEVITNAPLERATLLLSDLPGYWLQPVMQPGEAEGTGDLLLNMQATAPVTAQVALDNMGNRYTGFYRARLDLQINSPLVAGDQLTLSGVKSDGDMEFGTLGYSLPVGGDGVRLTGSVAKTAYQLGDKFASLNAHGTSRVVSAGLSYPLVRSRDQNLNLSVQHQEKRMHDLKEDLNNRKSSRVYPVALNFSQRDELLGGGVVYGAMTYASGKLNLDSELTEIDTETAKTAGEFIKWNLDLVRKQALPEGLEGSVRFAGQWTNKNLDSSEKFILGGAYGVRAYPTGEAMGDRGWMAQVEVKAQFELMSPYVFVDAGAVKALTRPWEPNASNSRKLLGSGVGVRMAQDGWNLDASLSWRIRGSAPQSDPSDRRPRMWVSLSYQL